VTAVQATPSAGLAAPERLSELHSTDLLDSPVEEAFDRFTRLLSRAVGVPVALVSLVDDERQFFKSAVGLAEPWASLRGTLLSHSFCQHVVAADSLLVVSDARSDPRVRGNLAIDDLSVVAYAGAPLRGPGGQVLGSLCAIDSRPRSWSADDLAVLEDLAAAVSDLIAVRVAAVARRAAALDVSHRVRSGLAGLRIEAEDLASAPEAELRAQASRVVAGLDTLTRVVEQALQAAERSAVPDAGALPLESLLAQVVAATGGSRPVVVAPGDGGGCVVDAPPGAVTAVIRGMVDVLLEHGSGTVTMAVEAGPSFTRVRVSDESAGLPLPVVAALSGRADGGAATCGRRSALAGRTGRPHARRSPGGQLGVPDGAGAGAPGQRGRQPIAWEIDRPRLRGVLLVPPSRPCRAPRRPRSAGPDRLRRLRRARHGTAGELAVADTRAAEPAGGVRRTLDARAERGGVAERGRARHRRPLRRGGGDRCRVPRGGRAR
jgi:GAF domain-containing protein